MFPVCFPCSFFTLLNTSLILVLQFIFPTYFLHDFFLLLLKIYPHIAFALLYLSLLYSFHRSLCSCSFFFYPITLPVPPRHWRSSEFTFNFRDAQFSRTLYSPHDHFCRSLNLLNIYCINGGEFLITSHSAFFVLNLSNLTGNLSLFTHFICTE